MEAQLAIESEPARGRDLLYGVPSIAEFLGLRDRQVRHLCEIGRLPTFKIGGKICARRSTISDWLAEQEAMPSKEEPAEAV